jgi:hypothetical protein
MVLPTASSVLPEEYASILPELFCQLYYNCLPLTSSLLRVWATSKRARAHSDLLVINRACKVQEFSVLKLCYAPYASRPWSLDLPLAQSFCNCRGGSSNEPRWNRTHIKESTANREHFACYRSSCLHTDLQIAVFAEGFTMKEVNGTTVVLQKYNQRTRMFPLDTRNAYKIKVTLVSSLAYFSSVF